MKMNIQESFVGKTLNRKTSEIVPKKLELDEMIMKLMELHKNKYGYPMVK